MRVERVRLEGFKCYEDCDLRLDRGVTVIHGLNGSGKSSLLEACFFALYGSKAIDETLDDVVTIGADECIVELWFSHGGESYHVTRRVRATGDRASTAKCVMETPDGSYEGARSVRRRVTELLRMDSDAFVNCAYVRQGEVNKLINASPGDRQDMIDDLLQLGKLETYRERASEARLGVKHVRDDKQGALSKLDEQIEAKEERDLHGRLNGLETELSETQAEIDRLDDQKAKAEQTRDEAQSILDEYEERREELSELDDDIEALRESIQSTEQERDDLEERIGELKQERESLRAELADCLAETDIDADDADDVDRGTVEGTIEELEERESDLQERIEDHRVDATEHSSTAESHAESAGELDSRASDKRDRADELEDELETAREDIADRRNRLSDLDDRLAELEAQFEDVSIDRADAESHRESVADDLDEARQRVAELNAELTSARESLSEAEDLLEAGKCPECGQDVSGSPHVESIDDERERVADLEAELESATDRVAELQTELERAGELADAAAELDRLETKRTDAAELIADKESSVEERAERVEQLRGEADELDARAEQERAAATEAREQAEAARSAIGECNQEQQTLKRRRERFERLLDLLGEIDDATDDIERLREQRASKAELNEERRGTLREKRTRKQDLAEQFDEDRIAEAREEKQRAETYIEKAESKLAALREERDDLQSSVGAVRNEIEALEELREDREQLARTLDRLESLYEETEQLQEMYGTLRAELRQRNVETLERMLNETFELVYQNDSYARIELDGEYRLTVYQKDGDPLDPEQLSGGERALFNLSLRCAIYRLLAEGIEGAAPMPPLILDEPTTFLDAGHVSKLLDLVAYMRDEVGVDQILVVSHDEELVGAADDLVRVEKDATTNRSTAERVETTVAELA